MSNHSSSSGRSLLPLAANPLKGSQGATRTHSAVAYTLFPTHRSVPAISNSRTNLIVVAVAVVSLRPRRLRLVELASLRDGKIAGLLARRKATSSLLLSLSPLYKPSSANLTPLTLSPLVRTASRFPHAPVRRALYPRIFLLLALRGSTFARAIVP